MQAINVDDITDVTVDWDHSSGSFTVRAVGHGGAYRFTLRQVKQISVDHQGTVHVSTGYADEVSV